MEYEHHILSLALCVEVFQIICDILHINLQKQTYCISSTREIAYLGTSRIALYERFTATSLKRSKTRSIARARQLRVCSYCARCSRNIPDIAYGTVIKDISIRPNTFQQLIVKFLNFIRYICLWLMRVVVANTGHAEAVLFSKTSIPLRKLRKFRIYIYIYRE